MAQKVFAIGDLNINDRQGLSPASAQMLSVLEGGVGLPGAAARTSRRFGRWPLFAALDRPDVRYTLTTHYLSSTAATRKTYRDNLRTELNPEDEDPVRLTVADTTSPRSLLIGFGPWDMYEDDDGNWIIRDVLGTARSTDYEIDVTGALEFTDGPQTDQKAAVVLEATTNQVKNPSAEIANGAYVALGAATISRSSTYQYSGYYSYSITTTANWDGLRFKTATLANAAHYVSFWQYGTPPNTVLVGMAGVTWKPAEEVETDGDWTRYAVSFTAAQSNGAKNVEFRQQGAGAGTFYIDAVQVEAKDHWTRYADGNLGPGFAFSGDAFASASTRTATEYVLDDHVSIVSGLDTGSFRCVVTMPYGVNDTWPVSGGLNYIFHILEDVDNLIYLVYYPPTQAFSFRYRQNGVNVTLSSGALTFVAGDGYEIICDFDTGGDSHLYVNGELKDSQDTSGRSSIAPTAWSLGSSTGAANHGNFIISEYQAWDYVLTAAEVTQINSNGTVGGRARHVDVICESEQPLAVGGQRTDRGSVSSLLVDDDVRWRSRDGDLFAWGVYSTSVTTSIHVDSDDDVYPVIRMTPSGTSSAGFSYSRWLPIAWTVDSAYTNYPYSFTLNTSTLNTNGKVQGDLDDLRVYSDGAEIDRWLDSTTPAASTRCWFNLTFQADVTMTLKTAIAGAGSFSLIEVNEDITNMPSSGILLIDDEAFVYTYKSNAGRYFSKPGVTFTRGDKGTSAGAHAAGATVQWIQHDVWVYYGDSSLSTPSVDGDYQPIFELDTSTNSSWVYQEFGEDDFLRTGQWQRSNVPNAYWSFYDANQYTQADPWEELGLFSLIGSGEELTTFLYNPCGITNANFTNLENRENNALGSREYRIVSKSTGAWSTEYDSFTAPSSTGTWTNAGNRSEALDSGSTYVGLQLYSNYGAPSYFECADCTVTLNGSNVPSHNATVFANEISSHAIAGTLTNSTTGDAIEIDFNMNVDTTLEIDTDQKTVTYLDYGSNQLSALTLTGGPRRAWFKLQPGDNVLTYEDSGVDELMIEFWWDRRYWE